MLLVIKENSILSNNQTHKKHPSLTWLFNRPEWSMNVNYKDRISMEFFLNVFTEFAEFSDKIFCHYSKRAQTCHLLCKRHHHHTCEIQDLKIERNSCFSDLSGSLNSLNSMKVLLLLGKTPMYVLNQQCGNV